LLIPALSWFLNGGVQRRLALHSGNEAAPPKRGASERAVGMMFTFGAALPTAVGSMIVALSATGHLVVHPLARCVWTWLKHPLWLRRVSCGRMASASSEAAILLGFILIRGQEDQNSIMEELLDAFVIQTPRQC